MKINFILTISILCLNINFYAQPVLNAVNFPKNYSTEHYRVKNPTNLTPGGSESNQTWDFSSISETSLIRTINLVDVSTIPYSSSFPQANLCLKYTNVGSSNSDYVYYKQSSTLFETQGFTDGNSYFVYAINPLTIFEFPYTFNKVINDTKQNSNQSNLDTSVSKYDAYGTIITPFGTFNNVIRVKSNQNPNYTIYDWYTTDPHTYIMTLVVDEKKSNNNEAFIYKEITSLEISKNQKDNTISIYPNPASSQINIQIPNFLIIDKVVLLDIIGKVLITKLQNTNQLDVENLPKGVYIIQAYSGGSKLEQKFIKN